MFLGQSKNLRDGLREIAVRKTQGDYGKCAWQLNWLAKPVLDLLERNNAVKIQYLLGLVLMMLLPGVFPAAARGQKAKWLAAVSRPSRIVNVTDFPYNAQCDGSTDDTAAIQAALNSGAAEVDLPDSAGPTYYQCNVSGTLTMGGYYQFFNGRGSELNWTSSFSGGVMLDAFNGSYSGLDLIYDMTLNTESSAPNQTFINIAECTVDLVYTYIDSGLDLSNLTGIYAQTHSNIIRNSIITGPLVIKNFNGNVLVENSQINTNHTDVNPPTGDPVQIIENKNGTISLDSVTLTHAMAGATSASCFVCFYHTADPSDAGALNLSGVILSGGDSSGSYPGYMLYYEPSSSAPTIHGNMTYIPINDYGSATFTGKYADTGWIGELDFSIDNQPVSKQKWINGIPTVSGATCTQWTNGLCTRN